MADNVGYTPGSGAVVAADDVGGALHQRIKLTLGADGVSDGDVSSANPMPVAVQGTTPVSASSLPLPTGAATEATLTALGAKVPDLSTRPLDNAAPGQPVRAIGQEVWNVSFADSGASVLSSDFIAPIVGTGVTYNQTSSSLNVVAGTSANAEFLTRSTIAWRGSMRLKFGIVASQRIANNNFAVLLADLIGEGLSYTINSATSVTVTAPGHTFTSQSVGQFINLAGITGAAGVPGRYAIASVVAGTSITFTVAGWPASGTGTLTLFGHSYVRNLFTGTTATNVAFDAQRRGWASGDTTATINTTASPGTVIHNELTGRECFLMDQLRATSTTPNVTTRASRVENIPDDNLDLYIWIWNFNGTTAPASSTTFTIGFIALEKFANFPVYIQGNRANGETNALPVRTIGNIGANIVQVGSTTVVTGGVAGMLAVGGNVAEDTAATSNPLIVGGVARTALPAATVVAGDAIRATFSTSGQIIVKAFAPGDLDFQVNATVTTNTQTAIRAAQAAGIRQNVTQITYQNTNATATTLTIQDGSTTLITFSCPANMANPVQLQFPTPLRGTAATALNYIAGTTGANVLLNVTGFNSY
jgi:hypothetical protein